ncbi:SIR2 family protein [Bacillus alkalicola]|uniref:SIR2 family protein n=2 Tax=Bacillaceae TaxID=186817 RepID=A0ABS6JPT8_9BACI|nr:SIR2 family protein [Bacillus alkalicola]MBU9720581.1 SIR2 family protein [Bacillus alkalicola]
MMNKFGMMIGNGFTIDFGSRFGLDPSKPFSYFNQHLSYEEFIHNYPAVHELFQLAQQEKNDYVAIERYMKSPKYNKEKDEELRKFLASSYSQLQVHLEKHSISNWKWTKWLQQNKEYLSFAVSFNYDLLFEKALQTAGINYYRTGTMEEKNGVPISKPHGSIDFDMKLEQSLTHNEKVWLEWRHLFSHISTIPKKSWLKPRHEADIIPPHKVNDQRTLHWVKDGINEFLTHARDFSQFIIVGLSYSEADRMEVNQYLEHLPPHTKVYVIDPNPNELLLTKISSLRLETHRGTNQGLPW